VEGADARVDRGRRRHSRRRGLDESLHRTPEIDAFLTPDRDDKFIVIGTKGFGKTLLLKAKRVLYQRESQAICLPNGSLLDKPIGDKIFGRESLALFAASPLPWSKVWLTAIALATLKRAGDVEGLKLGARLNGLLADTQLHSVIDHFVRLLDFTPSELQRCATETDGHLVPRLRGPKSSIAIFIDGIDEYFNKHVEDQPANASVTGELSPNVWFFAQLGLVEVAYQLRRINHHLKIFAAIKEACARCRSAQRWSNSTAAAQSTSSTPGSLHEIFVNNVRMVKPDRMVKPEIAKSRPLEAFLGRTSVVDIYTREEEDAFEYICRHTLLRPRDLMTIGERLTALRPDERRNEYRMKEAVNQAATEIAHEYLAEIAPYVAGLDPDRLFQRLPGHVIARAELEAIVENDGFDGRDAVRQPVPRRPARLRPARPGARQWRQRFLRPGERRSTPTAACRARPTLVHPVLFDVIARINPAFLQRIDRANIVGYDRPCETIHVDHALNVRQCCVLKADIQSFASLMRSGADGPVRAALGTRCTAGHRSRRSPRCAPATRRHRRRRPAPSRETARHLMDDVYPGARPATAASPCTTARYRRAKRPDLPTEIAGGDALSARRASGHSSSPARSGRPRSFASSSSSGRRSGERRRSPRRAATSPST
jgi:hypothetical protein